MSDRDPRDEAREREAGQEVQVAREPPREPDPADVRPSVTPRIGAAVGAAAITAGAVWLVSR
ncbi:MAG TPA: hypothetical protein VJP08_03005, partial [Actinomycetota bacterium]|nr:hypothetical protein [Actinomycetota bacterium]